MADGRTNPVKAIFHTKIRPKAFQVDLLNRARGRVKNRMLNCILDFVYDSDDPNTSITIRVGDNKGYRSEYQMVFSDNNSSLLLRNIEGVNVFSLSR
jgi:hypothetical protein